MNASDAFDESQDPAWRYRWLLLASGVAVLLAFKALASITDAWRWSLFLWGLPVGLVACTPYCMAIIIRLRRGNLTPGRRLVLHRRLVLSGGQGLFLGLYVGSLSVMFDEPFIDKLFTVLAVGFPVIAGVLAVLV